MAPRIAGLWAVPQYVDLMGARSREGPPEALRRADPMVVPPIVDLTGEQPSAELTGEPSIAAVRIMVALTVPITGLVPLRRASRLGRLPVPRRHRAIATTRPIVPRHRTIIRHTDRSPDQAVPPQHDELLRRYGAHSSGAVFRKYLTGGLRELRPKTRQRSARTRKLFWDRDLERRAATRREG